MNKAICWIAAIFTMAACILFYEAKTANTGINAETFAGWVERHNTSVEDTQR